MSVPSQTGVRGRDQKHLRTCQEICRGEMIRSRRRRTEPWRKQEAGPLIRVLPKYKYCTFFYLHQKEDKPTDPRTWGFLPRRKAFLSA